MIFDNGAPNGEHVIRRDGYDASAYEQARGDMQELRGLEAQGESRGDPLFKALLEDVFSSVFKFLPRVGENLPPALSQHKGLIEEAMKTAEWERLRLTTKLDEVASGLATAEIGKQLVQKVKPRPKRSPSPKPGEASAPFVGKDADEQRRILKGIIKTATEETEEKLDAVAALAGTEAGSGGKTDLAAVRAVSSQLSRNPKLRQIAALAGRMRFAALARHKTRVSHGPDEIVDIEVGRDLGRILPSEMVQLRHPILRRDFLRRYAEGQLLQYRVEGQEKLGKGPIVVCIDTSGSMAGQREVWAKGVALGLLAIARKEHRSFCIVIFGSAHELQSWEFDGQPDVSVLLRALEHFYKGGTDFARPLGHALSKCEESKYERADIIFITDGQAPLHESWIEDFLKRKVARGTRLYSILIGTSDPGPLVAVSDGIAYLYNPAEDAEALDLAFGI